MSFQFSPNLVELGSCATQENKIKESSLQPMLSMNILFKGV